MSAGFDKQIKELSIRTVAYHSKCQDLWTKQPPPPHYGAPFLFAYVWSTWSVADREKLVDTGRRSVQQNIAQMLSQSGAPSDSNKMNLLLACCVPEIFQDELFKELRPMAELLNLLWKVPTKADRQAAVRDRPKHISSEMAFIDQLPFVWAQPTVKLIEQTLQMLDYKVFAADSRVGPPLSDADNEMYQRDLLLSLRAFWLTYFGLQIFMNLSDHFHTTEEMLLKKQREEDAKQQARNEAPNGYKKPIHTMKIEDITDQAIALGSDDCESSNSKSKAATNSSSSSAAASASSSPPPAADPSILPSVPLNIYCAFCHVSPMAAVLSVANAPDPKSTIDPAAISAKKSQKQIELKRCSRCKEVYYCSIECQKKHFKMHKQVCQPAPPTASSSPPASASPNASVEEITEKTETASISDSSKSPTDADLPVD